MSYTSRLLEKYFEHDHLRVKCNLEVDSLEAVKEMVKMNAGIAALATWAVRKEIQEKSLVALPLGKRKLKRNWCLMRSPDRKPNLAEEKFAQLSLEATKAFTSLASVVSLLVNTLWQAGLFDTDSFPVQL